MYGGNVTYDPETEAKLDQWVQAKRARDFATSDAIQAELEAQGVDTHAARPDPRKAGGNPWGASSAMTFGARPNPGYSSNVPTYDHMTEAKLDQWVQAKRARDFTTSDAIQAELEAQGVDAKAARPDPRKAGASHWDASGTSRVDAASNSTMTYAAGPDPRYSSNATHSRQIEAKLDQWEQAKRAGDFAVSDAIQVLLEAQGVDANAARPDPKKGRANHWGASGGTGANPWGGSGGTYDPVTEAKLDQWVEAKRARDFVTSDAIQAELEAQGVDTHAARPDPRKAGANPWDASGGAWGKGNMTTPPWRQGRYGPY